MKYVLQLCDAFLVALSSCDRADLIALIARLQMEAKRRSAALRNERMTSGVTRSGDRSVTNNEQQVARLTKELNQTRQLLKAKRLNWRFQYLNFLSLQPVTIGFISYLSTIVDACQLLSTTFHSNHHWS